MSRRWSAGAHTGAPPNPAHKVPAQRAAARLSNHVGRTRRSRELASDRRAGRWARTKTRRSHLDFVGRNWCRLLAAALVMVLPGLAGVALVSAPLLRGFLAGVICTAAVATLAFWVMLASGTGPVMMGEAAEQWTADDLRRLQPSGWRLVNGFVLGEGDIDHVLLGPGGLYAIETKWSGSRWDDRWAADRIDRFAVSVAERARQLRLWHEMSKLGIREVRPVLVLWGAGAGTEVTVHPNGTVIVPGSALGAWRQDLLDSRLTAEQISACWSALDAQVRRRDATAAPCPRSVESVLVEAWAMFLAGCAAFASVAAVIHITADPVWWVWAWLAVVLVGLRARRWRAVRRVANAWLCGAATTLLVLGGVLAVQLL